MKLLGLVEPFQRVRVEVAVDSASEHEFGPALSDQACRSFHRQDPARMPAHPMQNPLNGHPGDQVTPKIFRDRGAGVRALARTFLAKTEGHGYLRR